MREEQLARVNVLGLHVHYLLRWLGISQLDRGPVGETTELEQAGSQMLSDDLLHPKDGFEQVVFRGSVRDKDIVLDHATHCDVGPLTLNVMGSSARCDGVRMLMDRDGGCADWVVVSVLMVAGFAAAGLEAGV